MQKGPKKGIDNLEVIKLKNRLQSMRWIPYLKVPTWAVKHEMHKGITPRRRNPPLTSYIVDSSSRKN